MDRWNWLAECLAESFQFSSSCSSQDLLGNITHSVVLYVVADSVESFRLITAELSILNTFAIHECMYNAKLLRSRAYCNSAETYYMSLFLSSRNLLIWFVFPSFFQGWTRHIFHFSITQRAVFIYQELIALSKDIRARQIMWIDGEWRNKIQFDSVRWVAT